MIARSPLGDSPYSPASEVVECEAEEAEIIGERSREERDQEGRKRAVDVEPAEEGAPRRTRVPWSVTTTTVLQGAAWTRSPTSALVPGRQAPVFSGAGDAVRPSSDSAIRGGRGAVGGEW